MTELMRRRRALMGAKKARLPAEYQEVEWIGYVGSGHFLITSIALNDTSYVIADIERTSMDASYYSGTAFPATSNGSTIGQWGTLENLSRSSWTATPKQSIGGAFPRKTIKSTKGNISGTNKICLGYGSASFCPSLRFYTLKVYGTGDVLLWNGVPCYRKSDGKIGMYDLIANKFNAAGGNSAWRKGADVT